MPSGARALVRGNWCNWAQICSFVNGGLLVGSVIYIPGHDIRYQNIIDIDLALVMGSRVPRIYQRFGCIVLNVWA